MKRLCFLSPDAAHARRAVAHLRETGIPEKHIYVIAHSDVVGQRDAALSDLPDEGPEGDDFLPGYERGLALGGTAGLFAGVLLIAFPPAGVALGGGAILAMEVIGAGLGGLLAGLAGAAFRDSRLREFESALAAGQILILADVPTEDAECIEEAIELLNPEVIVEGVEPPIRLIP